MHTYAVKAIAARRKDGQHVVSKTRRQIEQQKAASLFRKEQGLPPASLKGASK